MALNLNRVVGALRNYKIVNRKYPKKGRYRVTVAGNLTNASAGNKQGFDFTPKGK